MLLDVNEVFFCILNDEYIPTESFEYLSAKRSVYKKNYIQIEIEMKNR